MAPDDHGARGEPDPRPALGLRSCALAFVALDVVLFLLTPRQIARPLMMFGQMASGLQSAWFPQAIAAALAGFGL